ncbi:MAG: MarR family transcriptional regulator [Pseudomonadota bacterium]
MASHLHETLPFLVHRISAAISDGANSEFQHLGLNVYAARVLILLYLDDAHTVGELAETASLDQSTLSHILRRLVTQGLLVKERQEHDNRSVLVSLTKEGTDIAAKCWRAAQKHDALLSKGLSAASLATLKKLLTELYENAPAFRDSEAADTKPRKAPVKRKV